MSDENISITAQNLSQHDCPIATNYIGIPLSSEGIEQADFYVDEFGGSLERVSDLGSGWGMFRCTAVGLHPFELRTTEYRPVDDGQFPLLHRSHCPIKLVEITLRNGDVHRVKFNNEQGVGIGFWNRRIPGTQHVIYIYRYITDRAIQRFEGFIGTCDPTIPDTVSRVKSINVQFSDGLLPLVDFADQRQIRYLSHTAIQLVGEDRFIHGQCFPFSGRVVSLSELVEIEMLSALAQREAPVKMQVASHHLAHVLPFGTLPELHPSHDPVDEAVNDYVRAMREWNSFEGTHWEFDGKQTGVLDPRQTGSTETFGMVALEQTLACRDGFPAHLFQMLPDIYSELKRPSYFFEKDGSRFKAAAHPRAEAHGQALHYDPNVSPDQLGKPPYWSWRVKPTGGWRTEDFAHSGSSIAMGLCAMLDCSMLAMQVCHSDVELFKTITPSRNAFGQARGLGRSLLDLKYASMPFPAGVQEHVNNILEQNPKFKKMQDLRDSGADIVCYEPRGPDPRKFDGRTPFWMPWGEALQIPGVYAWQKPLVTVAQAASIALHGIWFEKGRLVVGDSIRWLEGGKAMPASEYTKRDGNGMRINASPGSYDDWVYPALALLAPHMSATPKNAAEAFCKQEYTRWRDGPAPRDVFGRPVPFFAVPRSFT